MIDGRALAKACTVIEGGGAAADELLAGLQTGHAHIVGITGPPGAGKSTLCDRLIARWRSRGKRVALIAVDPSSPVTGGAILGDRIRMQAHHADPGVFIRSMATRGASGGLAAATRSMARLFDAAGYDVVLIETVGVGQTEIEVTRVAQVTVLVLVPGAGDDVQTMKAGIMEIAQVIAINKADLPGADQVARHVHAETGLDAILVSAAAGTGIDALVDAIENRAA
jgi:LAO/AO transport system kinase